MCVYYTRVNTIGGKCYSRAITNSFAICSGANTITMVNTTRVRNPFEETVATVCATIREPSSLCNYKRTVLVCYTSLPVCLVLVLARTLDWPLVRYPGTNPCRWRQTYAMETMLSAWYSCMRLPEQSPRCVFWCNGFLPLRTYIVTVPETSIQETRAV